MGGKGIESNIYFTNPILYEKWLLHIVAKMKRTRIDGSTRKVIRGRKRGYIYSCRWFDGRSSKSRTCSIGNVNAN